MNPILWFARRREVKRLDRVFPNPRSAEPRGALKPHERRGYAGTVLRTAMIRLALLAALILLAVWFAKISGRVPGG